MSIFRITCFYTLTLFCAFPRVLVAVESVVLCLIAFPAYPTCLFTSKELYTSHKCSARALHIMFPPTLSYLLTNCKFRIQCACERQRVFVAVCMPYKMTNVAMRFHAQCSCVSPESFSNNSLIVFSH